jgi:hypothetical protein
MSGSTYSAASNSLTALLLIANLTFASEVDLAVSSAVGYPIRFNRHLLASLQTRSPSPVLDSALCSESGLELIHQLLVCNGCYGYLLAASKTNDCARGTQDDSGGVKASTLSQQTTQEPQG